MKPSYLSIAAALLLAACGGPDTRSFNVENAIFESLYLDRAVLQANPPTPEGREKIANGLAAICKGDTSVTRQLLRDGGIGERIYQLALIAAKARQDGSCDYSNWPEDKVLADRFKQLLNSGDAPTVLLAALIDKALSPADRLQVVKALADKRYSQAEAVYAGLLVNGDAAARDYPKALELLQDAAKQGATPGLVLLAHMHQEGLGTGKDMDKACKYLKDAATAGYEGATRELGKLQAEKACK